MTEREQVQDDALAFAAWLTSRPGVLTVGSGEECGPLAEAVAEWRKANPLRAPASEGEAVAWGVVDGIGRLCSTEVWRGKEDADKYRIAECTGTVFAPFSTVPLYTHPAPATVTEAMVTIDYATGSSAQNVLSAAADIIGDEMGAMDVDNLTTQTRYRNYMRVRDALLAALGGAR